MNIISFTIHFKMNIMCCKVFVECINCYGELEEGAYSSFQS